MDIHFFLNAKLISVVLKWFVVFCPAPIHEAVWAVKWRMSAVSLCYFRIITVCHAIMAAEYGNFRTRSLEGLTTQQSAKNQNNLWVKAVTWRIKLQVFYLKYTRTRLDTGFEPGEILVMLGTMCVTQCPEHSFLSATNVCSSKSENTCAINSSTDCLQLIGKTCWPAVQKI